MHQGAHGGTKQASAADSIAEELGQLSIVKSCVNKSEGGLHEWGKREAVLISRKDIRSTVTPA